MKAFGCDAFKSFLILLLFVVIIYIVYLFLKRFHPNRFSRTYQEPFFDGTTATSTLPASVVNPTVSAAATSQSVATPMTGATTGAIPAVAVINNPVSAAQSLPNISLPIVVPPIIPLPVPSNPIVTPQVPTALAQQQIAFAKSPSGITSRPEKTCAPEDKSSFVTDACSFRKCDPADKSSFVDRAGKKCQVGERDQYDTNDPERLRMELQLLEMRRNEISNRLNLNLNAGFKVGCNTDADCNVLNRSDAKNVCKVDHTCSCSNGGGTFCLEPANYRDPNEMTAEQRERFKMQNDISNFTKLDYIRWLMLYVATPNLLTDDHVINLQKLLRGDMISSTDIPQTRESPPTDAMRYLSLLDSSGASKLNMINSDAAGPYLGSNFNDYDMFIPPADVVTSRVITDDMIAKQNGQNVITALTPSMSVAKAS